MEIIDFDLFERKKKKSYYNKKAEEIMVNLDCLEFHRQLNESNMYQIKKRFKQSESL